MKKLLILFFAAAVLFACSKEEDIIKAPSEGKAFTDLKVQSDFDWKTTRDYTIVLKGYANSIVKIVSENNQTVYQSAMIQKNVDSSIKITLPTYEKSIRLKYMGQDVLLPLSSTNVNYIFN